MGFTDLERLDYSLEALLPRWSPARTGSLCKFQSTSAGILSIPPRSRWCPVEVNSMEMLWLGCLIPVDKSCRLGTPAEREPRNLNQTAGEGPASAHRRLSYRFGSRPATAPCPRGSSQRTPLRSLHLPQGQLALWGQDGERGRGPQLQELGAGAERVLSSRLTFFSQTVTVWFRLLGRPIEVMEYSFSISQAGKPRARQGGSTPKTTR